MGFIKRTEYDKLVARVEKLEKSKSVKSVAKKSTAKKSAAPKKPLSKKASK
jgi:hypothetical protein